MKFFTVVAATALLLTGAFARPSNLAQRMELAVRGANLRPSNVSDTILDSTTKSQSLTSDNWSGLSFGQPPQGQTFQGVVGTLKGKSFM
jgi:hypothetical protein